MPIEPVAGECEYAGDERLVDPGESPFEQFAHTEVRVAVEHALQEVTEPYRTSLILRDLEDMSYEEISEVLQISLGTVKSRITRGRDALRKKLTAYVREVGSELGLVVPSGECEDHTISGKNQNVREVSRDFSRQGSRGGRGAEVTP